MLITNKGKMVRTKVAGIRETGRNAQGVILIDMRGGEILSGIAPVVRDEEEEEAPRRRGVTLRRPPQTTLLMKSLLFSLLAFASCTLPARAADPAPLALPAPQALPFPQVGSDLLPDPAARFATLANGVRTVVLANPEPKGRASLAPARARGIAAGDRGAARACPFPRAHGLQRQHALSSRHARRVLPAHGHELWRRQQCEHRFRPHALHAGTRPFRRGDPRRRPPGLQRLRRWTAARRRGDRQGTRRDSFRETRPRFRRATGLSSRSSTPCSAARFSQTACRSGRPRVISHAAREQFVDFWNTWYRPEKLAVMVVGDFPDAAAVEKLVADDLREHSSPALHPSPRQISEPWPRSRGEAPSFTPEPEAPSTSISITSITPYAARE